MSDSSITCCLLLNAGAFGVDAPEHQHTDYQDQSGGDAGDAGDAVHVIARPKPFYMGRPGEEVFEI
jgi:hypothetical protein